MGNIPSRMRKSQQPVRKRGATWDLQEIGLGSRVGWYLRKRRAPDSGRVKTRRDFEIEKSQSRPGKMRSCNHFGEFWLQLLESISGILAAWHVQERRPFDLGINRREGPKPEQRTEAALSRTVLGKFEEGFTSYQKEDQDTVDFQQG
jgi:hypothetical protein